MLTFRPATAADALFIARGFHTAMLLDDTPPERISLFAEKICTRDDVLYSARNTTVAVLDGEPAGMITAYDGARYAAMRQLTLTLVKEHLQVEFPGMEDETEAGEYYLDSLAVLPQCRGRGIGRALLQKAVDEGMGRGLSPTLAVDPANKRAQRLYRSLGFRHVREIFIFGHIYYKWAVFK